MVKPISVLHINKRLAINHAKDYCYFIIRKYFIVWLFQLIEIINSSFEKLFIKNRFISIFHNFIQPQKLCSGVIFSDISRIHFKIFNVLLEKHKKTKLFIIITPFIRCSIVLKYCSRRKVYTTVFLSL